MDVWGAGGALQQAWRAFPPRPAGGLVAMDISGADGDRQRAWRYVPCETVTRGGVWDNGPDQRKQRHLELGQKDRTRVWLNNFDKPKVLSLAHLGGGHGFCCLWPTSSLGCLIPTSLLGSHSVWDNTLYQRRRRHVDVAHKDITRVVWLNNFDKPGVVPQTHFGGRHRFGCLRSTSGSGSEVLQRKEQLSVGGGGVPPRVQVPVRANAESDEVPKEKGVDQETTEDDKQVEETKPQQEGVHQGRLVWIPPTPELLIVDKEADYRHVDVKMGLNSFQACIAMPELERTGRYPSLREISELVKECDRRDWYARLGVAGVSWIGISLLNLYLSKYRILQLQIPAASRGCNALPGDFWGIIMELVDYVDGFVLKTSEDMVFLHKNPFSSEAVMDPPVYSFCAKSFKHFGNGGGFSGFMKEMIFTKSDRELSSKNLTGFRRPRILHSNMSQAKKPFKKFADLGILNSRGLNILEQVLGIAAVYQ